MDGTPGLDALVAPLRDDVVSGATEIAAVASEVVARAASTTPAATVAELRAGLVRVGVAVLDAQPSMAPLVTLVTTVLDALEGATDVAAGREAAVGAATGFRSRGEDAAVAVAARAVPFLPAQGAVLTLSGSSTVRETLLAHPDRTGLRVVVLEGRPMQEGRPLASALAGAGVPVTMAVDAAGAALVPGCALVLLGADSIGDAGVVNKVGSLAVAEAARRAGVPLLVLADSTKILPRGFPQHLGDHRPPEEVWDAPAGVDVWNRYFESFPVEIVTYLVTESATLAPPQLQAYRHGISVPGEVRAWAASLHRIGPGGGNGTVAVRSNGLNE